MKKIVLFVIVLFVGIINVDAIDSKYEYLYEITGLDIDSTLNVTMSGWGIRNAGLCNNNECKEKYNNPPKLNPSLASGVGDSTGATVSKNNCEHEDTYNYKLKVYGLKAYELNGQKKEQLVSTKEVKSINPGYKTDLTYSQCAKKGGKDWDKCSTSSGYAGACYVDVGYKFVFDIKDLNDLGANVFKFELYIIKNNKVLSNFFVTVSEEKITHADDIYIETREPLEKIELTSSRGYPWKKSSYGSDKDGTEYLKGGNEYQYIVCKQSYDSTMFLTWYKIAIDNRTNNTPASSCQGQNVKRRWVPAAWTAPTSGDFKIEIYPPDPEQPPKPNDVSSCREEGTVQAPSNKEINSCSGGETFRGELSSSCSVDTYSYYTKKCKENNYNASLKIADLDNGITQFNIKNGAGFTASLNLSTKFECEYTFDVDNFKQDYEAVLKNMRIYEQNSPDWYINYNLKVGLDSILTNYINQTSELDEWDSGYDFLDLTATLRVNDQTSDLVYDDEDYTKNTSCQQISRENINLNGVDYSVNTKLKCSESHELKMKLPHVCLNMKTGSVEDCQPESNDQIDGGNKIYVDLDEYSGDITVELNNLGYDGNWDLNLNNCHFSTGEPIYKKIAYRSIDVNKPFNLTIGKNFKNSKYDFINVIKPDTWNQNFLYRFSLSKVNVKNINDNTNSIGKSSYNGSNCTFNDINNKYTCSFVQDDDTNFFTIREAN